MLFVLAAFGLVLGGFGGMYALATGTQLLQTRDALIAHVKEQAERLGADEQTTARAQKEADAMYDRRGAHLPLVAANAILSWLLFLGCGRALRGNLWGFSAWKFAAAASVPYTVLACAFSLVQAGDFRAIYSSIPGAEGAALMLQLGLQRLGGLFLAAVELIYFVACVLYLRRPSIRALFLRPPAA
jgi:hypothetical protein